MSLGYNSNFSLHYSYHKTVVRPVLVYGAETRGQQRKTKGEIDEDAATEYGVTKKDEEAAMDVWSHEERSNQKRTCERINKSGSSDKEDHREQWYEHVRGSVKVAAVTRKVTENSGTNM